MYNERRRREKKRKKGRASSIMKKSDKMCSAQKDEKGHKQSTHTLGDTKNEILY